MSNSTDAGRKPRQQNLTAVIFDHDGTLVDSEAITLSIVADIAVEAGAEVYPEDIDRFVGADLHMVFEEIERRTGKPLPDDIFDQFRKRQTVELQKSLREIDGAAELLGQLEMPMAVASNAPVAKMELCLEITGLDRFFAPGRLVSAYDVNAWKPDPAVYLAAAEVLGVAPEHCAAVEDSAPGIAAAQAAGMTVFALDRKNRFDALPGVTGVSSLLDLLDLLPTASTRPLS